MANKKKKEPSIFEQLFKSPAAEARKERGPGGEKGRRRLEQIRDSFVESTGSTTTWNRLNPRKGGS